MLDVASPRVIYDVHARSWAHVVADPQRYRQLLAWVRRQGLHPEKIYRLEVYSTSALVFEHKFDEQGRRYCDVDHDHGAKVGACHLAKRTPYSVTINSQPEQEPCAHPDPDGPQQGT
ncbi:hypothetical protein [Nonomuraea sp. CA-141351]|uniref:hypothetical protein n=1 Tax=Nonomuraea sp. CA-141351 TaxID=3239996 RepID=UPI003D948E7D